MLPDSRPHIPVSQHLGALPRCVLTCLGSLSPWCAEPTMQGTRPASSPQFTAQFMPQYVLTPRRPPQSSSMLAMLDLSKWMGKAVLKYLPRMPGSSLALQGSPEAPGGPVQGPAALCNSRLPANRGQCRQHSTSCSFSASSPLVSPSLHM